ncbi:MAG: hypothetical protein IPN95_30260 [Bacteroidetes bacterium]|nr:hypothetical protein [Bacteroidota bacterium]
MVDPEGRFFSNQGNKYTYSEPIDEIGVAEGLRQIGFQKENLNGINRMFPEKNSRVKFGVVHGGFGPFTWPSRLYFDRKRKCDFLYIGIANPDPSLTQAYQANEGGQHQIRIHSPISSGEAMIKAAVSRGAVAKMNSNWFLPINFANTSGITRHLSNLFHNDLRCWGRSKRKH